MSSWKSVSAQKPVQIDAGFIVIHRRMMHMTSWWRWLITRTYLDKQIRRTSTNGFNYTDGHELVIKLHDWKRVCLQNAVSQNQMTDFSI